eukprot:jgi/Botrbrau1/6768/Bobra.0057s0004.1
MFGQGILLLTYVMRCKHMGFRTCAMLLLLLSFMATTCGLIAIQGLLAIMLDSTRLDRVKEFSDNDPIAKGTWLQPALKLAITEGMVLLAFLWFMQSIRLMVHLGFLMRVVPSARNTENYFQEEAAVGVALRSSICFTAGLRTFYAFIPLVMWMFGATALLISTVVELLVLYLTDDIPRYPKARKPKTAAEIRQALRRVRTPAEVEAGIQLPFTHNPQPSTQGNAHDQDGVAVGSD